MPGFTNNQWQRIETELRSRPRRYGLPTRRTGSVVIGSFNALKLGRDTNAAKRWDFLEQFASRYDLLAVQEVMDDLSGIRRLHRALGGGYDLLISDTTGAFPGDRGLRERLAFLYRPARIELHELVSDITYDRSRILGMLHENRDDWEQFFDDFEADLAAAQQAGTTLPRLSQRAHPAFLTFIRTPHVGAFSIRGRNGADAVPFLAVNAHTLFGNSRAERTREFFALFDWLVRRARSRQRMYFQNMILMADLNMQFDTGFNQRQLVEQRLRDLNSNLLSGQNAARVNFPFLEVHPDQTEIFRTNARRTETFDHVGLFIDRNELRLPRANDNANAGQGALNEYDYGVFSFVDLFAQALHGVDFDQLTGAQTTNIRSRAAADVSDHLPIWVRVPIPGA